MNWENMERDLRKLTIGIFFFTFLVEGKRYDEEICKRCVYKRLGLLLENADKFEKLLESDD